jgi:hypothetical protein
MSSRFGLAFLACVAATVPGAAVAATIDSFVQINLTSDLPGVAPSSPGGISPQAARSFTKVC